MSIRTRLSFISLDLSLNDTSRRERAEMSPRPKTVKLKGLEDLIHVLSVAQMPLLHHVAVDSRHVYFVPVGMIGDVEIVYYVESHYPLQKRFILYNTFTGEVRLSDYATSDSRIMVVPIVEVERHNLFQEKIFFNDDKKSKKKKERQKEEQGSLAMVLGKARR